MFLVCSIKARRPKTADFDYLDERLDALEGWERRLLEIVGGRGRGGSAGPYGSFG
jgi:hypothetical protein